MLEYIIAWIAFLGLSCLAFLAITFLLVIATEIEGLGADQDIKKANQACLNTLLADVVTDTVRNVLHIYKSRRPADLFKELSHFRKKIQADYLNKDKKILNKEQFELLFPGNNTAESDSSKFDISLLLYLLSHVCFSRPPSNGWWRLPLVNDRSHQAEIVRIRLARNTFIHTPLNSFDNTIFDDLWNQFREASLSLGCNRDRIDMLNRRFSLLIRCKCLIKYIFSFILAQAIGTAIFLHEITLNRYYRRRKKEGGIMHKIENVSMYFERTYLLNKLIKVIETKATNIYGLVIAGPGGIGKTETAKAICNKIKRKYRHIIWMTAATEQEIKQEFLVLYHNLKLDYVDRNENAATKYDSKSIAYKVYDFFNNQDALFVFDNVVEYNDIKDFLPVLRIGQKYPVIIITSQIKIWNANQFLVQEIGVFTEEEAVNFVYQNCESINKGSENAIEALVKELSCLPLGLVSAVSYLNDNRDYTVEQYLKEYKEFTEDILDQDITDTTGYNKTALTTWKMTMQKLDMPSIRLIQLLSYLDGKKIKKDLLTNLNAFKGNVMVASEKNISTLADGPKLNKAITKLNKYSLINETYETNANVNVKCINVHSLIQTVVRFGKIVKDYRSDHSTLIPKVVIEIICVAIDNDNGKQTHYNYGIDWIRHLYQTLSICKDEGDVIAHFLSKNKEQAVQDALISKGNYILCHNTFQILSGVLTDEPKKLSVRSVIAYALLKMGKYKKSEEEYSNFLEIVRNDSGFEYVNIDDESEIISAEYFIGHCRMKQEHYKTAIETLEIVGKKQISKFTEKSREYLLTQHDIAYSKFKLAQYEDALNKFKEIYEQQILVCGEYHKDTLLTSHSIGHTLIELGRYEEAKTHLSGTLAKKRKAFGDLHHETLITHHTLGLAMMHLKQLNEARNILYEVYDNKVKALGKENPSTLTTYHRVGNAFMEDKLYDDALVIFHDVLELRKKVIGAEKERTLMTENDIGYCYMMLCRYDEAIDTFKRIDEIQVRLFSDKKINSMSTKFYLAQCYIKQKNFVDALSILQGVKERQEEHFGEEHKKTMETQQLIEECEELLKKNV